MWLVGDRLEPFCALLSRVDLAMCSKRIMFNLKSPTEDQEVVHPSMVSTDGNDSVACKRYSSYVMALDSCLDLLVYTTPEPPTTLATPEPPVYFSS